MNDKHAWWKWLILALLTIGATIILTNFSAFFKLGLDLQGGTSFTVKIDEEKMRENVKRDLGTEDPDTVNKEVKRLLDGSQERAIEVIRNRVDQMGIAEPDIKGAKDNRIIVQLPGVTEEMRKDAETVLESVAFLEFRLVHDKNDELVRALFDKGLTPEGYLISTFKNESVYVRDPKFPKESMNDQYYDKLRKFHIPDAGHQFMLEKETKENQEFYRPYFVERKRRLTGEKLRDAYVDYEVMGQPVVILKLNDEGRKVFARVTKDYSPGGPCNLNPNNFRMLGIVLDDRLYSAPRLIEPIPDGNARITGSFTVAEAGLLANILKAGSLPAPVKIIEKRYISASLGSDSIRSGVTSALWGSAGVLIFMLIYYRLCGLVANIGLFFNTFLLPIGVIVTAGLLQFALGSTGPTSGKIEGPVITLPGIAGIALTIGMAVDANVLIYERIREELGTGKRLWAAIVAGYDRAFLAIFDSNLTTILSGLILFFIAGSGPIRGFAVTLIAGLIVSMYTALTVTKLMFDLLVSKFGVSNLSMMQIIKNSKIDFLSVKKIAISLSLIVIVGSAVFVAMKQVRDPDSIFGVDFTGGVSVSFKFKEQVKIQEIRKTLEEANIGDPRIQYQTEMNKLEPEYLRVECRKGGPQGVNVLDTVKKVIPEKFAGAGFVVAQDDEIQPVVARELKLKSMWALLASLVLMIVYISLRFEFGFALGAIVALAHDVLVTAGIFAVLGNQFSLTFVASALTIIGYSVNDTIVIFDRIRENLKMIRNMTFAEICNLSVNQTLSRTILTSGATMITVLMILIFGGGALKDFALSLFIGMIAGTYSTVFIATPVALWWTGGKKPAFAIK